MADIGNITSSDRTIDILHPGTKEPLGIKVSLMHIDDTRLKRLKRKITDERLRLESRGKNFKAEDIEENKNNILFSAMTGWEWGKDADGEQNKFRDEVPEFNRKNVVTVLDELPWFADQVNEAVADTEAFFTNSKSI